MNKEVKSQPEAVKVGVRCPGCGSSYHRVYTTRHYYFGTKRYHICQHCQTKFVTIERVEAVK